MATVTWTPLVATAALEAEVPIGRSSSYAGMINNRLYVFSGENIPRVPIDANVYSFDLDTRKWARIGTDSVTPSARVGHAGVVVGHRFFIYGGRSGAQFADKTLDDLWAFDTHTATWALIAPSTSTKPPPLSYHTMSANGDIIYVFGGCTVDGGRTAALWQFDSATNEWTSLASSNGSPVQAPSARGGSSLVYVDNDQSLRVLFGYNGKEELADQYRFDLTSNTWSAVSVVNGPSARSVTDVVNLPSLNALFVFGGEFTPSTQGHEGAGQYHGDSWLFDIAKGTWTKCDDSGTPPSARGWFNTVGAQSSIVVFGGFDGSRRLADIFIGLVAK